MKVDRTTHSRDIFIGIFLQDGTVCSRLLDLGLVQPEIIRRPRKILLQKETNMMSIKRPMADISSPGFSKMRAAVILDLIETKIAPLDPPTTKTSL